MSTVPTAKAQVRVHIRWMIRRDMPEVLAIEHASYEFPWCEEEFLRVLRQRNCIGMVAECGERVVGFMIYELHKSRLQVLNLAVAPEFRRMGVGRQMVAKLVGKLSSHRRTKILLQTRESNLSAQLYFRALDFRAVEVVREAYEDTGEDAYVLQYVLPDVLPTELVEGVPVNRIARQLEG
ncbi:ribosomal protein S18-alanine N-acetyltransferase [Tautonia rosea]|uniref:ribosomal protein S18-alanine N-acetyltransferase n=1 Tax=Tautonia rosea TaxID=2728037 RepID=UPI0014753499|nr:ribosomal protein S18-alanine N-acetyltransferase [Tautonia rosea]